MRASGTVREKSVSFTLKAVVLYRQLSDGKEFIVSKQFLKSASSVGANIHKARGAQSARDFVHKLEIALKEAYETEYWLTILKDSELTSIDVSSHLKDIAEIIKMLTAIIKSKKANMGRPNYQLSI